MSSMATGSLAPLETWYIPCGCRSQAPQSSKRIASRIINQAAKPAFFIHFCRLWRCCIFLRARFFWKLNSSFCSFVRGQAVQDAEKTRGEPWLVAATKCSTNTPGWCQVNTVSRLKHWRRRRMPFRVRHLCFVVGFGHKWAINICWQDLTGVFRFYWSDMFSKLMTVYWKNVLSALKHRRQTRSARLLRKPMQMCRRPDPGLTLYHWHPLRDQCEHCWISIFYTLESKDVNRSC